MYMEIDTASGVLGLNISEDEAGISTHRGRDVEINIPASVNCADKQVPVTYIGRKAFLSDKNIRQIHVPDSVTRIDEWAFAGCRALDTISIHRAISVSNGAFKDCVSLECVELREKDDRGAVADTGFLLAASIRLMEDRFLFDLTGAGSTDWYGKWDMRLRSIMDEPDEEGFSSLLACGEEDYEGRDNSLEAYLSRRRQRKIRLCMVRLMHDHMLAEDMREALVTYIYEHRAGTANPDSWIVVLNEHGDEEAYYKLLGDCGCIDPASKEIMLKDMGEKHTLCKSFLIRYDISYGGDSFFDSMSI